MSSLDLLRPRPFAVLVALTLSFAAASPARAQGTWRWLQPTPSGADLRDVAFADTQRGVAVGSRAAVLRTSDGGTSWSVVNAPGTANLVAVSMNGTNAVAVGTGLVLRSTDSGATFTQVGLPAASATFVDVQLVTTTIGFALTSDGTLYSTTDAFSTLIRAGRVTLGTSAALWFDSATRGWVGGTTTAGRSFLARTIDGGRTFTQVYTGTGSIDAVTGFSFAGAVVVIAGGSGTPRLAVSNDQSGQAFDALDLPTGAISSGVATFGAAGSLEFWFATATGLVGGRADQDAFQTPFTQSRPRLWGVAAPSFGSVIAVGEGGTIVRATFNGAGQVLQGNRLERYTEASFPTLDGQSGALVDNQAGAPRPFFTTNGGTTFTPGSAAPSTIVDVSFADARNGLGLTQDGQLFVTANGGSTFTLASRFTTVPNAIAYAGNNVAFAAGSAGVLRSSDNGRSWSAQPLNPATTSAFVDIDVSPVSADGNFIAAAVNAAGELYTLAATSSSGSWTRVQNVSAGSNGKLSIESATRLVVGGTDANGVGRLQVVTIGATPTQATTTSPVRDVAFSAGKVFALLEDGTLEERTPALVVSSSFASKGTLLGLAARTIAGSNGRPVPAPFAFGDFGALLVFDDVSSPVNQPPVLALDPTNVTLTSGQTVTLNARAGDPEGEVVTITWSAPTGLSLASQAGTTNQLRLVAGTPAGTYTISVKACDARIACVVATITVTVAGPPNQPPTVALVPPAVRVSPTQPAVVLARGQDPENQPLTYTWLVDAASGLVASPSNTADTTIRVSDGVPPGDYPLDVRVCDPSNACTTATLRVTVLGTTQNRAPVAAALGASTVAGEVALLDGTLSSDPDGDPLVFSWTQLSGNSLPLIGDATQPILLVEALTAGTYVYRLEVCDTSMLCSRVEVTVVVVARPGNLPPAVSVPARIETTVGATFILDASASLDPEGGQLGFAWRQVVQPGQATLTLLDGTTSIARSSAAVAGNYRFIVRVCDTQNQCAEGGVDVVVTGGTTTNRPPVASVGDPQRFVRVGERVTLTGTATDPDNDRLTLRWTDSSGILGLSVTGPGEVQFVVPRASAGQAFDVVFEACDPQGLCDTERVSLLVVGQLTLVANAGPDQSIPNATLPLVVNLDGSASIGEFAFVRWERTAGNFAEIADAQALVTTVTIRDAGRYVFLLTVTGATGETATDEVVVVVDAVSVLTADAGADRTVGWGARVELNGTASRDPDNRGLTYRWTGPDGITITGADTPIAVFFAPARDIALDFLLNVCVQGDPNTCDADGVRINVRAGANLPPLVDAGPDRTGNSGDVVALDGSATFDPEGGVITAKWNKVVGPNGLPEDRNALWTRVQLPAVTEPTDLTWELEACDVTGACATDRMNIRILPRDERTPSITVALAGPDGGDTVDEAADFALDVRVTCPAAPCRNAGLVRVVSGPPVERLVGAGFNFRAPGVSRDLPLVFEASVCDTGERCAVASVELLVRDTVNEAPVPVLAETQLARARQRVTLDAADSYDPNGDALLFRWSVSDAPGEVVLSPVDGARPSFALPAGAPLGDYVFTLELCDARGACTEATTTVTLEEGEPFNRPPVASAGADRSAPSGVPVSLDGTGSFDPDLDDLSYEWAFDEGTVAELSDVNLPRATLFITAAITAPVKLKLTVCDPFGACSEDRLTIQGWAVPRDETLGTVTLGEPAGCSCDATSMPGLLGLLTLGSLSLRRRRTSRGQP